jgi:predicted amidophosphoribosyltransferase
MANLDTFYCASCGKEFVVTPGEKPACPACGAPLNSSFWVSHRAVPSGAKPETALWRKTAADRASRPA